jgi:hypothetical protein
MLSSQYEGITGQLATSAPASARGARQAERKDCRIGAGLRQRGATGVTVQIMDLSTHGFRASTHLELEKGTDVWLKLPGLEGLHARVKWTDGYLVGCEFVRPLHPAVLQMMVTR